MTVYTGDIETTARAELGNANATQYPAAVLDRAINEVTSDFSRVMPEELVYETTYRKSVSAETWTSGAAHGTYVALANALIRYNSEVVKNAALTVTYTRDTDYTIDYANGKMTTISGGAMATGTAFSVSYDRNGIAIKISSITDLIAPVRVEAPLNIPQEDISFWRWGNYLFIKTSEGNRSQDRLGDRTHIRVYYYGTYTAPTASARGTFPAWLDDVMIKGVVAYALGTKSRERGLQAIAYLQDSAGSLRNIAGSNAKLEAALQALSVATTGSYARMSTAETGFTTTAAFVNTALDALDATGGVYERLSAALGELAEPHSDIGSAIAALKTATSGPYARIDTALAALSTPYTSITTILGEIEALQDAIHIPASTGDLKDAADVWTDELAAFEADLQANVGAGVNLIQAINIGGDAAEMRRRYAELFISKAQLWSDKRKDILHRAEVHVAQIIQRIAEASAWARKAETYIAENQSWLGKGQLYLQEIQAEVQEGQLYIAEAQELARKAELHVGEAAQWIRKMELYLAEFQAWVREAETRLAEANMWQQEGQNYMAEAQRFIELSNQENQLSIQLKTDALERHTDYWSILMSRIQMARPHGQVAHKQYVSPFTFTYPTGSET